MNALHLAFVTQHKLYIPTVYHFLVVFIAISTQHHTLSNRMPHIALLATGGTIAGLSNATGRYDSAQLDVSQLVASMQEAHTSKNATNILSKITIQAEQIAQIDSKDMNWRIWQALHARIQALQNDPNIHGIVILHGSDTMEETAFFLHATVTLRKPLILTCAMRPADAPDSDGARNMLHSIALVTELTKQLTTQRTSAEDIPAKPIPPVLGVCAEQAWSAMHLRKNNGNALAAFGSGLGKETPYANWQETEWCIAGSSDDSIDTLYQAQYTLPIHSIADPCIATLCSHAGVDEQTSLRIVEALPEYSGLLVETTGSGTIHKALTPALSLAHDKGIVLARSSRCPIATVRDWPVLHTHTGQALPWLATYQLHTSKARVLLALELLATC